MQPTVISLFAGCGGSSLGYRIAGYRELLAIDFNKNACETFALNFPEVPCWRRDVRKVSGAEMMKFCKIKPGELDVLDGSPPCQGFSMSGKRDVNDSRNDLFREFARLIGELKPRLFIMENVGGMARGRMRGRFNEILSTLRSLGYAVRAKQLNAANYGVPQSRQRIFFIGIRNDIGFRGDPFPKHAGKPITAGEALKGIDNSGEDIKRFMSKNSEVMALYRRLKPGQVLKDIHPKGSYYNLRKLDKDEPSYTLTASWRQSQAGLLHWGEDRFMTIAEIKRLSSFPDDFKMAGSFEDRWARIGNAVMPLQMKAIAEAIRNEILEKTPM